MPKKISYKKITILVAVAVCITSIWFVKNLNTQSEAVKSTTVSSDFSLNIVEEINITKLKSYKLPIIIDFGADSCASCKMMAPILEKLNTELRDKAIIRFVDVWKYSSLANGFPVRTIPTQIFIDAEGNNYNPSQAIISKVHFQSAVINKINYTYHEGGLKENDLRLILSDMEIK